MGGGGILPSLTLSSLQLPLGMQQNNKIWRLFPQYLMNNKILNIKMITFYPEPRSRTIFGKSPC